MSCANERADWERSIYLRRVANLAVWPNTRSVVIQTRCRIRSDVRWAARTWATAAIRGMGGRLAVVGLAVVRAAIVFVAVHREVGREKQEVGIQSRRPSYQERRR